MGDETVYKVFLSSPSDVAVEREAAMRVVRRVNAERTGAPQLKLLRWEDSYYTAASTFQDQIEEPGDCDLVVCLFWKSLGSDLPEDYRDADGHLPTGTEYEFENALNRSLASDSRQPDVLVYRKTADVFYNAETVDLEKAQRERLLAFWQRWFQNEKGHFVAGFHSFDATATFEALFEDHIRQWIARREASAAWTGTAPYIGLRPFTAEDAAIFFGRDRDIHRARARLVANALNGRNLLAVVGQSGSGKSSLVLAGLLPRLAETRLTADRAVLSSQITVRPSTIASDDGTGWATGLAGAMLDAGPLGAEMGQGDFADPQALADLFRQGGESAVRPISRALDRLGEAKKATQGLVLFIDQVEEIFAYAPDRRDAFAAALALLLKDDRIHLLMTMRSEYLARLQDCPPLATLFRLDAVSDGTEPILMLKTPRPADLRDIITQPAARAGLSFEDATQAQPPLDQRIEADAASAPLPALQFLLAELYAARDGTTMTHDSYGRLGGVAGVIARRGDAAIAALPSADRAAFPGLARKLVATDSLTETVVSRAAPRASLTEQEDRVAAALIDDGLLVADAAETRLAHEVLITGWDALADIVEGDRRLLEVRHRLSLASATHETIAARSSKEAASALLQGFPLAEGRELLGTWDEDAIAAEHSHLPAFIRASDRADRARGRNRILAIGSAVAAIAAAIFLAAYLQLRSAESEQRAELGAAIAAASEAALRYEDWPVAVREAKRARELADSSATLSLAMSVILGADVPFEAPFGEERFAEASFGFQDAIHRRSAAGDVSLGEQTRILPSEADVAGYLLSNGDLVAVNDEGGLLYLNAEAEPVWLKDPYPASFGDALGFVETATHFSIVVGVNGPSLIGGYVARCAKAVIVECSIDEFPMMLTRFDFADKGEAYVGRNWLAESSFVLIHDIESQPMKRELPNFGDAFDLGLLNDKSGLIWGAKDGSVEWTSDYDSVVSLYSARNDRAPAKVAVSSESNVVGFSCGDATICTAVAEPDGIRLLGKFGSAPGGIRDISISSDGSKLMAHLADGRVRIWRTDRRSDTVRILPFVDAEMATVSFVDTLDLLIGGFVPTAVFGRNISDGTPNGPNRGEALRNVGYIPSVLGVADETGRTAFKFPYNPEVRLIPGTFTGQEWVEFTNTPHRLAFAPSGDLLATSPFALERHTTDGTTETLVSAPEGLGIGGVTTHGDTIYFGLSNGALMTYGSDTPVVPHDQSADTLAPLSLDIHPGGRFLVATRADDKVLIHDLEHQHPPARLDIPTIDSKVVEFSPSGDHVAVLTTAGGLGVWRFDATTGKASPHYFVDPVPPALKINPQSLGAKAANWVTWTDDETLAIASESGDAILLTIDPEKIDAELAVLDGVYDQLRSD